MLLSEVALGNMYPLQHAQYMSKAGYDSTKGIGRTTPNPDGFCITIDDVLIPMGTPTLSSDNPVTSLLYNEYIVYDVDQINIKYLLRLKFNFM